jgi:hypothetical protein
MAVFYTILAQSSEKTSSAEYLELLHEIKSTVRNHKPRSVNSVSFLDEFVCLYDGSDVAKSAPKLANLLVGNFPRAALLALSDYVRAAVVPSRRELLELRGSIDSLDISNLGAQQLREVVRMYIFINHPVLSNMLDSYKPIEPVASKNTVFPTKAQIKEISECVPSQLRGIANEGLRAKLITDTLVYRLHLIQPHLTEKVHVDLVEKVISLASPEMAAEVSFLEKLNEDFRTGLFPSDL